MTPPAIALHSIHKTFGETSVLRGLDLTVPTGEIFALLGRNAAGKTTTIRMLLGLLRPDRGSVRVLDLDPARDALSIRQRVGYLAEDQRMFPWMRVEQLIRFTAPFYPTWDHAYATELATQFEVPTRTRIRNLSKGASVRLGLLLALAHRPNLVILDDPAMGLDPIMRGAFNRDLITHLQGEGRTVVYSSHLLHEVEPIADTVAILDGGVIVREAGTETLRSDVKRMVIPRADSQARCPWNELTVLDYREHGGEIAIIVDNAAEAIDHLHASGCPHRSIDLNLDEIFEAYVAGRRPEAATVPTESVA